MGHTNCFIVFLKIDWSGHHTVLQYKGKLSDEFEIDADNLQQEDNFAI